MKFNCGSTKAAEKRERWLNWHRVFAWWPTRVGDNDCRWLECIERKYDWVGTAYLIPYDPKYRAIGKPQ